MLILFWQIVTFESGAVKGPDFLHQGCRDMQDVPDADVAEAKRSE